MDKVFCRSQIEIDTKNKAPGFSEALINIGLELFYSHFNSESTVVTSSVTAARGNALTSCS